MYHGLTGSAADKYRADQAARVLALFEDQDCATWRDKYRATVTAVTAEETDEGIQQKLSELATFIEAWDQALTQRRTRGNEQGT